MPRLSAPSAFAICAHPDDVELTCFGLLARLQALGWRIGWAIATDGAKGGEPAVRRAEAISAAALLGVAPVFLDLPDGALAGAAHAPAAIADVQASAGANLVITHTPEDYHPDHRALARLVGEACRHDGALIYADGLFATGPAPDILIDTTPVMALKAAAIACHRSQASGLPATTLKAWTHIRGAQTFDPFIEAAEAFTTPAWSRASALAMLVPVMGRAVSPPSSGEGAAGG